MNLKKEPAIKRISKGIMVMLKKLLRMKFTIYSISIVYSISYLCVDLSIKQILIY